MPLPVPAGGARIVADVGGADGDIELRAAAGATKRWT